MRRIYLLDIIKNIILETHSDRKWKAYWLDPHGNFHEVYLENNIDGHWNFAKKYIQKHIPSIDINNTSLTNELLKRKWTRVTYNYHLDNMLYIEYKYNPLDKPHLKNSIVKKMAELQTDVLYDDIKHQVINIIDL
jgi:hypothetical protein